MESGKLQFIMLNLFKYLTPKKSKPMAKHEPTETEINQAKQIKKLIKDLKTSTSDLKKMKQQFGFPETHYISITIRENEKHLQTLEKDGE
jgi:hypothetical protein